MVLARAALGSIPYASPAAHPRLTSSEQLPLPNTREARTLCIKHAALLSATLFVLACSVARALEARAAVRAPRRTLRSRLRRRSRTTTRTLVAADRVACLGMLSADLLLAVVGEPLGRTVPARAPRPATAWRAREVPLLPAKATLALPVSSRRAGSRPRLTTATAGAVVWSLPAQRSVGQPMACRPNIKIDRSWFRFSSLV